MLLDVCPDDWPNRTSHADLTLPLHTPFPLRMESSSSGNEGVRRCGQSQAGGGGGVVWKPPGARSPGNYPDEAAGNGEAVNVGAGKKKYSFLFIYLS